MVANRSKKPRVSAAEEDDALFMAIQNLQKIQEELEKVHEEANEKIIEIEREYVKKRRPVYVRRNKIISAITDFWFAVFLNHPTFQDLLTEKDKKILEYLDSVNVEDFEDSRKGYCITFTFKSNPFFKNKKLKKTIKILDEGTLTSVGTTIYWKVGKGLADERKGSKRPFPVDSFFSWLSSPKEDKRNVECDLLAEIIKEDIWSDPIDNLNDLANNLEDDDDDEEDDDDEDEDEDQDSNGKK